MAHPAIIASKRLAAIHALERHATALAGKIGIDPPIKPTKSMDPQNGYVKQLEAVVDFLARADESVGALIVAHKTEMAAAFADDPHTDDAATPAEAATTQTPTAPAGDVPKANPAPRGPAGRAAVAAISARK